jgi:hypothetical protein
MSVGPLSGQNFSYCPSRLVVTLAQALSPLCRRSRFVTTGTEKSLVRAGCGLVAVLVCLLAGCSTMAVTDGLPEEDGIYGDDDGDFPDAGIPTGDDDDGSIVECFVDAGFEDAGCLESSPFLCSNGYKIPGGWVCDGVRDCEAGEDEEGDCQDTPIDDLFVCSDGVELPASFQCDSYVDCMDGGDEVDCPVANDGGFVCQNGYDVWDSWVCDGAPDCPDGDDEWSCNDGGVEDAGTEDAGVDAGDSVSIELIGGHERAG